MPLLCVKQRCVYCYSPSSANGRFCGELPLINQEVRYEEVDVVCPCSGYVSRSNERVCAILRRKWHGRIDQQQFTVKLRHDRKQPQHDGWKYWHEQLDGFPQRRRGRGHKP